MNTKKNQEKDEYPIFCLSFSPNWNTHQIVSTNTKGMLIYGSNSEAFLIDFKNKTFLSSIKPHEETSLNQLKVTSVLLKEDLLFIGYSNGIICAFNHQNQNQFLFKTKVSQYQIFSIIQRSNTTESVRLILSDSEGNIFELIYLHEIAKVFSLGINCASQLVNCEEYFNSYYKISILLTISQKGIVALWNLETKQEIFSYNTNSSIYKADFLLESDHNLKCGLITKKSFLLILQLNLNNILNSSNNAQKIQTFPVKLNFQLQSKFKSDPEILSSKPNILFIGKNKILISGKTGELFLLSMKTLEQRQEIELKHLSSITEEEVLFQVVERNPHYKQIYAIGKYIQQNTTILYTLGNDRKLSFWKYEEDEIGSEIIPLWTLNFLGGKVRKIATSELEKNKIFFTCTDKTIRVWDLEKKNNKFSTQEIWKQVSQTQIYQIIMHPSCEGICAYSTEDNKLCLYDIFGQICFKVLKLETGIRSIQWIHKDFYQYFVNFANEAQAKAQTEIQIEKEEGEDAKVNLKYRFLKTSDPNFTKKLPEDYMLMAVLQDNNILIFGTGETIEFFNAQLLKNQDSFNYTLIKSKENNLELIITTGSKDGEVFFWKVSLKEVNLLGSFKYNNYHISAIRFNKISDGVILCATSSHDRKIVIYEINTNSNNNDQVLITPRMLFKHKNKVDDLKWSCSSKLLAVSNQDKTVQIWDCSLNEENKKQLPKMPETTTNREVCNIRGHDGFITDASFSLNDEKIIITASDDQTIKVWNVDQIFHKGIANPKKKNKKKQRNKAILEEEPGLKKQIKYEQQLISENNENDTQKIEEGFS